MTVNNFIFIHYLLKCSEHPREPLTDPGIKLPRSWGSQTWYTYLLGRFTTTFVWLSFEEYGMAHFGHQTFIANMWPVKIAKSCLKWLHYKNERFWHLYKNCQKCRQFGQNDSCHWLWKVAQKCNKSPNLVTLIAKYKGHDK